MMKSGRAARDALDEKSSPKRGWIYLLLGELKTARAETNGPAPHALQGQHVVEVETKT